MRNAKICVFENRFLKVLRALKNVMQDFLQTIKKGLENKKENIVESLLGLK